MHLIKPIRKIITSHSIDNTFESCARKFEFLNVFDRRPPRESGFAAEVGTALHEGVQEWLIARAEGDSERVATEKAFIALLRRYPWALAETQRTNARKIEFTVLMLYEIIRSSIWDQWELVRIPHPLNPRGWAIEVPFLIDHTSLGTFELKATGETCMLATQGKMDFILRHVRDSSIRVWDLKTTILSPNLVRSEYTWSGQQVGYGNVLQAILGHDVNEFEVNYLVARFAANDPPQVQVVPLPKDESDVDDYWLAKIDRLKRMINYSEAGWFPRKNGGCNAYQNECSCFDICHTRDTPTIQAWFSGIGAIDQTPYQPWVTLEL